MTKPYDNWFLRLESCAATFPGHEALPFLLSHANRLGVAVIGDFGEFEVTAFPGCTIEDLTREYARARASSLTAKIGGGEAAR